MASNTHVDTRVQERRLRPIYDWLDSGNNKKALQEAEKVLKKQPNFLCTKVLKALALQRLGREAECEEILEDVCKQVPTDEATLQAISICYKAIHKRSKICEVYSAASKKDPTNEELLTHLFMSYVRIGDYRKQHQHAMSLYKLRPKNPYYFWAVMSVVMQAKNDDKMEKNLALKLAEKMVTKFVAEGKIEAGQEVQLYLMILEMQGKYEEALDVIEGELGEKLKSLVTTAGKRIDLLIKLERWKEANVLLKCQLEKNPDSWSDYRNYLRIVLKLYSEYQALLKTGEVFDNRVPIRVPMQCNSGECIVWYKADYTLEMAKKFFQKLIQEGENSQTKIRGPYLALLEFYKVVEKESFGNEALLGNVIDLLVDYFERFSDKPICVSDLKPYLSLLNKEFSIIFLSRISEIVGVTDEVPASSVSSLQRHISQIQLTRLLGFHDTSIEERLKLCNSIIGHYESSKKLVSPDKLPTDFACNDPYIIILSHILFTIYEETKCRIHIIRAIYYLENALAASPSNFNFKLLLVKFYLLLGAGQQAFHFYDHLETKYIQLDSMGYLIGLSGYALGCITATVALYDTTLKFFFNNTNDIVDHLTYAYKYGSFTKIQEFIEFRDRLNDSLHYTFCTVEKMLHDLLWTPDYSQSEMVLRSMDIKPGKHKIRWESLRDNRDLKVIVSYEPPDKQLGDKTIEKTFENLKNYVKLRDSVLNTVFSVFYYINDMQSEQNNECLQNGDADCPRSHIVKLVSEMNSLYNELKSQDLDLGIQEVIDSPPPCRLKVFLKTPVCQMLSDLINIFLLIDAHQGDENKLLQYSESVSRTVRAATNSCVLKINAEGVQCKELLEELVSISELYAVGAIMLGHLKKLYKKRLRKNLKKGKKKKEDEGCNNFFLHKNILKDFSECIEELDNLLSKVGEINSVKQITGDVEALSMHESISDFSNIEKKLYESYAASVQEIRHFLQEKQFYINALKTSMAVMDNIAYVCFCRSIFSSIDSLRSHKLYCEQFKNTSNRSTTFEKANLITKSESQILRNGCELIRLAKSEFAFLKKDQESSDVNNENSATNFWGRKLPKRTKVPYLSRAVPLSIDHSYERCQCGAVFVTSLGKRQHQARFCKIIKSKSEKIIGSKDVTAESEKFQMNKTEPARNKCLKFVIKEQLTTLRPPQEIEMERQPIKIYSPNY